MNANQSYTDNDDDNLIDFDVQPGVLSAIAFVTLEAIAIGLIDYATGRALSWYYYRLLEKGEKITLQEANIPGLTRYQIGKRFAFHNIFATIIKIVALGIIFYINLSITSRTIRETTLPVSMSTFVMSPSDARWDRGRNMSVIREYDESRACVEIDEDNLTFYPIVFNLSDGVKLDDDSKPLGPNDSPYEINRSSIVCANSQNVMNPSPLARVSGCAPKTSDGCKNSTWIRVPIKYNSTVPWLSNGGAWYKQNERYFNLTEFDPDDVQKWFPQFPSRNTLFVCLSYFVGSQQENQLRYTDCLLVYRPGEETWVQKWRYRRFDDINEVGFVLLEPGPIFVGDFAFERTISVGLLMMVDEDVFGRDDYLKISSNLVALSSEFIGSTQVYFPNEKTVSSLPVVAIGLAFVIFTFAVFSAILVIVALLHDSRPRFNTIFGLSTVMKHHFGRNRGYTKSDGRALAHPVIGVSDDDEQRVFVQMPSSNIENKPDAKPVSVSGPFD